MPHDEPPLALEMEQKCIPAVHREGNRACDFSMGSSSTSDRQRVNAYVEDRRA